MAIDDPPRGQAYTIRFPIFASGETLLPGASPTADVSKDGGAFAASANAVSEVGNGIYALVLTATEMDVSEVVVIVSSTGLPVTIFATTAPPVPAPNWPGYPSPAVLPGGYPSAASVTQLVRTYINDTFKGRTGTPGEGRIFTDDAPFVIPLLNEALNQIQTDLEGGGVKTLRKEVIISGIPPINGGNGAGIPDPAAQQSLGFAGLFDGTGLLNSPVLPVDCLTPLRLWQRTSGTGMPFSPFPEAQAGLVSGTQGQTLGQWEWRGDAIYWNGSILEKDIRVRYSAQAGAFRIAWAPTFGYPVAAMILDSHRHVWAVTTPGVSDTSEPAWPASPTTNQTQADGSVTWTYQSTATATTILSTLRLPFMDSWQAVAAWMAATFSQSRLPEGSVDALIGRYTQSVRNLINRATKAKQYAPVERLEW